MHYINRKEGSQLETVDQFETRKEAIAMAKEYRISDPYAQHYVSTRCCKAWKN